jgi:hypothetical protein
MKTYGGVEVITATTAIIIIIIIIVTNIVICDAMAPNYTLHY